MKKYLLMMLLMMVSIAMAAQEENANTQLQAEETRQPSAVSCMTETPTRRFRL